MNGSSGISSNQMQQDLQAEQSMMAEQQQMNMQEEQMQTQSSIQQAHHDTMMSIIKAIAQ